MLPTRSFAPFLLVLLAFGCKKNGAPPTKPSQPQSHSRGQQKARAKAPARPLRKSPPRRAKVARPSPAQAQFRACIAKHSGCPALGATRVALWLHDRKASASLTYDDSMPVQYRDIYPIQAQFGFRATYFLYTRELLRRRATDWGQSIRNWKHWRAIQAKGNEIGSHSISHPYLSKVPFSQAKRELVQSCRTIKKYVPKAKCETLAYPYGDSNEQIRRFGRRYYIAARQAKRGVNPPSPPDMMNVRSVIPMMSSSMRQMEGWLRRSLRKRGWTVWMFHGTKGQGWEPLTLPRFRKIFQLIKRYEGQIWVGTFGEVAKYIKQRKKTRPGLKKAGYTRLLFAPTHSLDRRYRQPLTFLTWVPASWRSLKVQQGQKAQTGKLLSPHKSCPCLRRAMWNAVPNEGKVLLTP